MDYEVHFVSPRSFSPRSEKVETLKEALILLHELKYGTHIAILSGTFAGFLINKGLLANILYFLLNCKK